MQGSRAASANNLQPVEVIVVTDTEKRKELSEIAPKNGPYMADSPAVIAVISKPEKYYLEDGSAATQNILLEVHSLGLGACWIGTYGGRNEESAKRVLNVPEGDRLLSVIAIGHPAESPQKTRKEVAEVTFTDRYGSQ